MLRCNLVLATLGVMDVMKSRSHVKRLWTLLKTHLAATVSVINAASFAMLHSFRWPTYGISHVSLTCEPRNSTERYLILPRIIMEGFVPNFQFDARIVYIQVSNPLFMSAS